jgi:hypothetical protein
VQPQDGKEVGQRVFAGKAWYVERPEPEELLAGILERVRPPSGPAGRPALSFVLRRAGAGDLPVYAAGVERVLGAFAGRPVSIRGKRVDFERAGFAIELWTGEIGAG